MTDRWITSGTWTLIISPWQVAIKIVDKTQLNLTMLETETWNPCVILCDFKGNITGDPLISIIFLLLLFVEYFFHSVRRDWQNNQFFHCSCWWIFFCFENKVKCCKKKKFFLKGKKVVFKLSMFHWQLIMGIWWVYETHDKNSHILCYWSMKF